MNKSKISLLALILMTCLNSCAVIGGIFKAGAIVGVIAVVIVIALVIWIFSMFKVKNQ